ncbi:hypothetical protein D3C73_1138070 [compost metagenome]
MIPPVDGAGYDRRDADLAVGREGAEHAGDDEPEVVSVQGQARITREIDFRPFRDQAPLRVRRQGVIDRMISDMGARTPGKRDGRRQRGGGICRHEPSWGRSRAMNAGGRHLHGLVAEVPRVRESVGYAEAGGQRQARQVGQDGAARPVINEARAAKLLQGAVHMHGAEAQDVGEHVLGEGKMQDAGFDSAQTALPLVQLQQEVRGALIGAEPTEPDHMSRQPQTLRRAKLAPGLQEARAEVRTF